MKIKITKSPRYQKWLLFLVLMAIFLVFATPVYLDRKKRDIVSFAYRKAMQYAEKTTLEYKKNNRWPIEQRLIIKKRGDNIATFNVVKRTGEQYVFSIVMEGQLEDDLKGVSFTISTIDGGNNWKCRMAPESTDRQLYMAHNIHNKCQKQE